MTTIQVALPVTIAEHFDYRCTSPPPPLGARVRVPFQSRELYGIVIGHAPASIDPDKLRDLSEIPDEAQWLSTAQLELIRRVARYYQHNFGESLFAALPAAFKRAALLAEQQAAHYHLSSAAPVAETVRGARLQELLGYLGEQRGMAVSSVHLKAAGFSAATLKRAVGHGWIDQHWTFDTAMLLEGKVLEPDHRLTAEQDLALKALEGQQGTFGVSLLQGVTGSGKTEVYLRLMRQVLEAGQRVMILVPEIGLAPQTLARIQRRLDVKIALLHSARTDSERLQTWLAAATGRAGLVIGTRSAVFTPLPDLGLIIVDEEHDLSFKQQQGMHYNARDVALIRAKQEGFPVVLGSATPALETLHHALQGDYQHLHLRARPGSARPPRWEMLDIRRVPLRDGLSLPLLERIQQHLARGEQVLVFLNRRGFAPALMCYECGWLADCRRCDTRYTLHQQPARLWCHHCDGQRPVPFACPECGSRELNGIGVGTERIEQVLKQRFPEVRVLRIDRDSVRHKGELEQKLALIRGGEPAILVGTQMLSKGHHFPAVTLVAVVDSDGMLFSSDFRAMERGAQQLVQVGGRAGRGERPGQVLLQTRHPQHPALVQLLSEGYPLFAKTLLAERRELSWPPFGYLALCRFEAVEAEAAQAFGTAARQALEGCESGVQVLGPVPAPMPRRQGRFRFQLLLCSQQRAGLHRQIHALRGWAQTEGAKLARKVRWSLDVDPQEMV